MLIDIETPQGIRKVRVCDYCKSTCIPSGRFCSGRCCRQYTEQEKQRQLQALREWESKRNA
jgi:predicted nucleic acid-binding Zn ribbon protein